MDLKMFAQGYYLEKTAQQPDPAASLLAPFNLQMAPMGPTPESLMGNYKLTRLFELAKELDMKPAVPYGNPELGGGPTILGSIPWLNEYLFPKSTEYNKLLNEYNKILKTL